jgi:hypothetical protein
MQIYHLFFISIIVLIFKLFSTTTNDNNYVNPCFIHCDFVQHVESPTTTIGLIYRGENTNNFCFVVGILHKYQIGSMFNILPTNLGHWVTTTKCGCNSLILVQWTNDFNATPLGPIHWDQCIHSKSSESIWHIGSHFIEAGETSIHHLVLKVFNG